MNFTEQRKRRIDITIMLFPALFGLMILLFQGCRHETDKPSILYINSYHNGYGSSDDITLGIKETLAEQGYQLEVIYMDTKRHPEESYIRQVSQLISDKIEKEQPDIIIASDDNAVQHIVSRYLRDSKIPVVFCGVNWSAEAYDLPADHVTGMLEVLPFEEGIQLVRKLDKDLTNIHVLSENTASERKNTEYIREIADKMSLRVTYTLARDFGEWKTAFLAGNINSDLLYLPTNGAIEGWNDEEAIEFVKNHIRVPVITCDDFMMPFAVFGVTKVQSEQGKWAAETALKILDGTDPAAIPVARNQETMIWFNPFLAGRLRINPDEDFLIESKIFDYQTPRP